MKKNQLVLDVLKKVVSLMAITSIFLPQITLATVIPPEDSTVYPVQLKVITTVQNNYGGTLTPSDFTIRVYNKGSLKDIFTGVETGKDVALNAGSYGVTETLPPFYTAQLSGNCAGNVNEITVPCNVTYRDVPHLKVITVVNNNNGGTSTPSDFLVTLKNESYPLTTFPGTTAGYDVNVNPGSYEVDSPENPSYTKTLTGDCSGTVSGALGTCTITYNDIAIDSTVYPVQLKVITIVNNDNGGTATSSDFFITVKNKGVLKDLFSGTADGKNVALNAGTYSVEPTTSSSYDMNLTGDCSGTVSGALSTCTITYDDIAVEVAPEEKPAPKKITSSGSRTTGGRAFTPVAEVLGTSTDAMVLGTSTTCGINLTSFLRIGQKNDTVEVKKLQQFLNEEMKSGLPITGFFGPLTFNAVKTFQLKYKNDILTPWLAHGMENDNVATGYVYKTTKYMINKISCESLNLTTPKLP